MNFVSLAVDLALACIVAEAALLVWIGLRRGLTGRPFATLGAGFSLLVALRFALAQTPEAILPMLALAGLCHIVDVVGIYKQFVSPRTSA